MSTVLDEFKRRQTMAQQQQARALAEAQAKTSPEEAARRTQTARQYGVSPDVASAIPYDHVSEVTAAIGRAPRVGEWIKGSGDRAALARGDFKTLADTAQHIETAAPAKGFFDKAVSFFRQTVGFDDEQGNNYLRDDVTWANTGRSIAAGFIDLTAGLTGFAQQVAEQPLTQTGAFFPVRAAADAIALGFGGRTVGQAIGRQRETFERFAEDVAPGTVTDAGAAVMGGIRSLPLAASALVGGAYLQSARGAATLMGGVTSGLSYGAGREAGLSTQQASLYGAIDGMIEAGTELIPFARLLPGTGSSFLGRLASSMAADIPGEQAATFLQDLNQFINIDQPAGKTMDEFLAERGSAAFDTLVASVIGSGSLATGVSAAEFAARKLGRGVANAGQVEESERFTRALTDLAKASQTLQRDPQSFEDFVRDAADESGGPTDVYVEAAELQTVLNQSGLSVEQVYDMTGYTPEALQQLVERGEDIAIPIETFAARIAPQLGEQLVPHLRLDPDDFSRAQAETYMQEAQAQFQADADAQLELMQQGDERAASRARVEENILAELNTARRFTEDTNRVYASLVGAFFEAQSAKVGQTAEQLAETYGLRVQSGEVAQPTFDQTGGAEDVEAGVSTPVETAIPIVSQETQTNELEQQGDREAGAQGRELAPLEGAPTIEGATGPDPALVAVAESYAEANGIPYRRQREYVEIDPEFSARVADAYAAMEHAPNDPAVREAYENLIAQTRAQYDALVAAGYEFTFFDDTSDPYDGNPWAAMRDLRQNKRMAVFGTYAGYGTEGITQGAVADNPMLADTGLVWPDQNGDPRPVTANDLFRAVHDAFGHGLEGAGFRARGEENAWQAHARLFTGSARAAITTETRGQNSWLNFGPYGEQNRTAAVEDTVFADQKTGLMPEWTWQERFDTGEQETFFQSGPVLLANPLEAFKRESFYPTRATRHADGTIYADIPAYYPDRQAKIAEQLGAPAVVAVKANAKELSQGVPLWHTSPPINPDGTITLQHWGPEGVSQTDPSRWGESGTLPASERGAIASGLPRTYFGIAAGQPGGYIIEFPGRVEYQARVPAEQLYDIAADPDGLRDGGSVNALERKVKTAGYLGYWTRDEQLGLVATVFEPLDVQSAKALVLHQDAVFFSALERAIERTTTQKASAQQWAATLKKTPGIKEEELEWTGLLDFLADVEGPVTREQMLEVVRGAGIRVDEVLLGDNTVPQKRDFEDEESWVEARQAYRDRLDDDPGTQFASWTTAPGDPSYRELLLTLPIGLGRNPNRAPSTHWDTDGVIAHARFMDKTDADGKKVLFIEEVQSDWHQKGRDEGYQSANNPETIRAAEIAAREAASALGEAQDALTTAILAAHDALPSEQRYLTDMTRSNIGRVSFVDKVVAEVTDLWSDVFETRNAMPDEQALVRDVRNAERAVQETRLRYNEANQALARASSTTGIPNAPFRTDWPALVMKRMIRWAAEHGYERIAWTTGDQQEQRYWNTTGTEQGEGMRGFYDRNLVNITNKLVKKYGARVSPSEIIAQPETITRQAVTTTNFGFDITPELADAAMGGFPLFQKTGAPRGQIAFAPDITQAPSVITLLRGADLSTFVHELGHFFFEVTNHMANQAGAPAELVADRDALLRYLGVESATEWENRTPEQRREGHERVARSFEAYLFEGTAPSVELQGVFAKLRSWMLNVYRTIRGLNVELTDEARGVFDRMLASEEQIAEAEADAELRPFFRDKPEGMTDADWEEYQRLGGDATAEAARALEARSLRDMRYSSRAVNREIKRLQRQVKEQRDAMREEVEAELSELPVYRAIRFLRTGKVDDQTVEGEHKLNTEEVRIALELDGAPLPDGLKGMTRKGGLHPQQAAEMFGFTSADHLLRELLFASPLRDAIEAETDSRMRERYGDLNSPEEVEEAARAAVHNDVRARFVATELAALQNAPGKRRVLAGAARRMAEGMIARVRIRDLRPSQYEVAERRAARAAQKAGANDLDEAVRQKRNQLLQFNLAKAAHEARDETKAARDYLTKFNNRNTRANIDKTFLDQIDQLLERFELRQVSNVEADRRKSLADWIAKMQAEGYEPAIDPETMADIGRKPWRELTVEEMRGLLDAVRNIEHLGRLTKQLLTAKDKADLDTAAAEMGEAVRVNATRTVDLPVGARTWFERLRSGAADFFAMHRKIANMVYVFDGNRYGGVFWERFIRPMNERGDQQAVRNREANLRLAEIFSEVARENTTKRVYEPAIERSISLEDRLMVALNMGNEANLQRLMSGDRWSYEQVQAIVAPLTSTHWDFVERVWAEIDSYWPEIAAKEERVSGIAPEKVEPLPFQVEVDGQTRYIAGGYFPIKYDADKSARADADESAEVLRQMTRGLYTNAQTRRGHTKERVAEVNNRPLRKDFGVIFSHVNQVIHDLTWHEYLIDANRLLKHGAIDSAIREHYGPETVRWMRKALEDIAIGDIPAQSAFESAVHHLRTGVSISAMGWSVWTSLLQPTGLTQSMSRIGSRWVMKGLGDWIGNPAKANEKLRWIREVSPFMRERGDTMQREINEIKTRIGAQSPLRKGFAKVIPQGVSSAVGDSFFYMIAKAQLIADVPTWLGQYEKSMAAGETHDRAVAIADQAVIDSQGAGQTKDLAGIQRGAQLMRLFTNFYSYFSATFNLMADRTTEARRVGARDLPYYMVDMMLLTVVPATVTSIMYGLLREGLDPGDEDDQEQFLKNIAVDNLTYMLGLAVGVREVGSALAGVAGYQGPAGVRFFSEAGRLGKQLAQGEVDEPLIRAANSTAGILLHYPASQLDRTARGVIAFSEGDDGPEAILMGPEVGQ